MLGRIVTPSIQDWAANPLLRLRVEKDRVVKLHRTLTDAFGGGCDRSCDDKNVELAFRVVETSDIELAPDQPVHTDFDRDCPRKNGLNGCIKR